MSTASQIGQTDQLIIEFSVKSRAEREEPCTRQDNKCSTGSFEVESSVKNFENKEQEEKTSVDKQWASQEINPESITSKADHFFCRCFRNYANEK